jgi:hypothetical protein
MVQRRVEKGVVELGTVMNCIFSLVEQADRVFNRVKGSSMFVTVKDILQKVSAVESHIQLVFLLANELYSLNVRK